ncbi:hypothetical protein EJ06DRAFT_527735 [Trichodelitschia bisporula]|uniref:Autophagy-related protein 6 n=1 Tax=Trichodelitschia bisporula TaxID=703511 RepID=A0A6G1I397_9PEZI|nr:hypothetical protein EJ06DRAFT_527735 [Trichodelitschia bisporula]
MGWLWGKDDNAPDAVNKLDPSLRDFLEREAPKSTQPAQAQSAPSAQPRTSAPPTSAEDRPVVPEASLYKDGRYAHIWKNYRPLHEIEAATKNENDKLRDLVDLYEDRKKQIGRTALENCSLEMLEQQDCFTNGTWLDRTNMCRDKTRAFGRCYDMQIKFLKALGFLSVVGRPEEEEEKIQMHAYRLYQQMLEQERIREAAKETGQPTPELEPVLTPQKVAAAFGAKIPITKGEAFSSIPEPLRADFKKTIENKTPEEAAIEEAVFVADIERRKALGKDYAVIMQAEKLQRQKRWAEGRATVGDRMKRWWGGWDD